jgi:tetratricopeptide (TPR) repeat protein
MSTQQEKELFYTAKKHFDSKQYDKAKDIFNKLINTNEYNNKNVYIYLGEIYAIKNEYKNAIKFYKKALNFNLTDKEYIKINYKIGYMFMLEADNYDFDNNNDKKNMYSIFQKAEKYLKKSLDKRYKDYFKKASIWLGICLYMFGNYKEAIKVFEEINNKEFKKVLRRK